LPEIHNVVVQFGASGALVEATPTGPVNPETGQQTFARWTTGPRTITGVVNDVLQITARALNPAGGIEEGSGAIKVTTVRVDRTPPVLSLTTPDDMTQAAVNGQATFQLAGAARDELSPVAAVEWLLGQGQQFTLAIPKAPGDWSSWTAAVQVPSAGTYQLRLRAPDGEGNITPPKQVTLHALETFQPQDPTDVFNLAAYLDDLLKFAGRRMVDAQGVSLTPARFTTAYRQHFADLTKPNNREAATAAVHQVRVCVEVLRAFLAGINKNTPAAEEAKYRQVAYAALLRNLGTSFDEIRRARGDEATRLAARLGVDRPDRLDQLVLLPEQITEKRLEEIFGLVETTATRDPLVRGPRPLLLIWQLDRLRAQWQEQDNAAQVYGEIPVPIIDSDLLVETDFRTRNKDADPAFGLWDERNGEMTDLLKRIDTLRKSKTTPLVGFDAVVSEFVTKVEDLTTLLADYEAGKDIAPRLTEKRLPLAAFLRLMRSRKLANDETIADPDWADVYSIAAQVTKLGRYPMWRAEEQAKGLTLSPDYFVLPDHTTPLIELPEWRATPKERRAWQVTLQTRMNQQQEVIQALRAVADAAEAEVLPGLRDLLAATAGDAARGLLIDLDGGVAQRTSRVSQAIETLQGALFAVRVGASAADHAAAGWNLAPGYTEADFDADWVYWGSYQTWQGAMRVFIYPESHLLPTLRPEAEQTDAFKALVRDLRALSPVNPQAVRGAAKTYLGKVRGQISGLPDDFVLREDLSDKELADLQTLCKTLFGTLTNPHLVAKEVKEVFYFVPLLCALQLQRAGEYVAALDWFQRMYAYHLPPDKRKIYHGLTVEKDLPTKFDRPGNWPREGLNAHDIVRDRANALTRFTIVSLVRCFEQFADAEYTRDTNESIPRARALYQTALDLLGLAYPAAGTSAAQASPFGLDPVVDALRLHAQSNLRKLRLGRNIAGLQRQISPELAAGTAIAPRQPTPYRYAALIARAKELSQNAAQMEAALLAALEKHETESYNLLKAIQDVELASETVRLQNLRLNEAADGIRLAKLQKDRARIQFDHFEGLLDESDLERETASTIAAVGSSVFSGFLSGAVKGGIGGPLGALIGGGIGAISGFFGQSASQERREEEWRLQRSLAQQDIAIGDQQVALALDQVGVALQEHRIAGIRMDHAGATAQFLAGKFTSAELYEFMSEVLAGVYRFFLQQATAMAKLAENQLGFERQEAPQGVIQGDYYTASDGGPDRRGMTGSARLLADIVQLDQHAFLTDRRKQQLTKTFSLARLAPVEFQRFRETGVMVIGTPQELFDRDFPGHYLRLVRRVRTDLVALISSTEGIHATLSAPGTSRVVIGGDTFRTVVVRRDPETVGLSSPRGATGLFELVPDSQPELLLPFEGTGVDTVWRFELPKAANPFDYSTIVDVLLTLEYTALNSFDYRQQVIQTFDPELRIDRPFSFRQQFPDQWYELHNPDRAATPMSIRFKTVRGDFLPNINDLRIQHVVLYLAPVNGQTVEIRGARLQFKRTGDQTTVGGPADSIDGVISTRRANGDNWRPIIDKLPIGEWELALPNDEATKSLFKQDKVQDILLVISYSGRTPDWPI
jgi:hypothetical protein